MKKLALALMAASAAVFGFGMVASAQTQYGTAIAVTPNPVVAGGAYTVTYANCVLGDTITFTQAQSTPTSVTGRCTSAAPTLTGSVVGILLPAQQALGTATGTFTNAPTAPGTFNGTGIGQLSPSLPFQFTLPGQVATTLAPTTVAPTTLPATVPGVGLPTTGSGGLGTTTGIAIGLLAVGLGLFVVAQVRRRQQLSPA